MVLKLLFTNGWEMICWNLQIPFLKERMLKNTTRISIAVVLIVSCSTLGSCATATQKNQLKLNEAVVHNNRGFDYCQTGQYDRAISDFGKAIKMNPQLAPAYNNRGAAYLYKGQYDQAISDLSRAIEINPRLAHAYNNRGWAHIQKWQYAQAISDFSKTIEIDPGFVEAYFYRAVGYFLAGEYEKSLLDVTRAQQLGYQIPDDFLLDVIKATRALSL